MPGWGASIRQARQQDAPASRGAGALTCRLPCSHWLSGSCWHCRRTLLRKKGRGGRQQGRHLATSAPWPWKTFRQCINREDQAGCCPGQCSQKLTKDELLAFLALDAVKPAREECQAVARGRWQLAQGGRPAAGDGPHVQVCLPFGPAVLVSQVPGGVGCATASAGTERLGARPARERAAHAHTHLHVKLHFAWVEKLLALAWQPPHENFTHFPAAVSNAQRLMAALQGPTLMGCRQVAGLLEASPALQRGMEQFWGAKSHQGRAGGVRMRTCGRR